MDLTRIAKIEDTPFNVHDLHSQLYSTPKITRMVM